MNNEVKFVEGLFVNERKNAPDYVRAKMSINVDKFIAYLHQNKNEKGYVNFDILTSKGGKDYAKLDDWKPQQQQNQGYQAPQSSQAPATEISDDLPF